MPEASSLQRYIGAVLLTSMPELANWRLNLTSTCPDPRRILSGSNLNLPAWEQTWMMPRSRSMQPILKGSQILIFHSELSPLPNSLTHRNIEQELKEELYFHCLMKHLICKYTMENPLIKILFFSMMFLVDIFW